MWKDILKYFKETKEMTPIFYYWKKWDLEVIWFLVNKRWNVIDPKLYGDIENFFDEEYDAFGDDENLTI